MFIELLIPNSVLFAWVVEVEIQSISIAVCSPAYGCGRTIFWFKFDVRSELTCYQMRSLAGVQVGWRVDPLPNGIRHGKNHRSRCVQGAYTKDATFENATPDAKEAKS